MQQTWIQGGVMNERLENFAKEAGLAYIMTPDKPFIKEDLEKFAKLILEECIGLVGYYEYGNDGEAADFADDAIKYHFGVE